MMKSRSAAGMRRESSHTADAAGAAEAASLDLQAAFEAGGHRA